LTTAAFINAYLALRRGDSKQANRMFRARVLAQGFTIVAMVAGSMYYSKDREKTAELRKLKEQRDAEEKRQKWIRELEARDEEEKAIKTRLHEKIQAAEANFGKGGEAQSEKADGGILGKIGFWSSSEKKPAEETTIDAPADDLTDKKHKRENPKSSLGALGEIISTQKKDADGKKPN
jgi:hypothetical protein